MCGIAGIIAKRPVNSRAVKGMIDRLAHRGPDGQGVWMSDDGLVCLGHRRLIVIDPSSAGRQPMIDPTGRYVITFNGEIYNYLELGKKLQSMGVSFRSKSDTEVLLEAYKMWGKDCLQELNGMFAFAIYDKNQGEIFCARDRFGEKPFLFFESPDYIAFASEYKALFVLDGIRVNVDNIRLLRFLDQPRQGLDDERETVFIGVHQLLPAEYMLIDVASLEVIQKRYWGINPNIELSYLNDRSAAEQFRVLLENSVHIRMRSDVPVGSCLSGGLDSSSIVSLNRKILGNDAEYHTFTGVFPGTSADESEFAEIVRNKFNLIGHIIHPTDKKFVEDLAEFIWFNELPVGSASQFAQWSVFRLAKNRNITVLLDGQGADEVLGGYEQYFCQYLEALSLFETRKEVEAERSRIQSRYPKAFVNRGNKFGLSYVFQWYLANFLGKGSDFLFGVSDDLAKEVKIANYRYLDDRFNPLSRALKDDALFAHLPTLLRYGDRNSMAHSREVRLPFCDHRIVEFSLSLNPKRLMGNTETKHLLRNAMSDLLPLQIQKRWNKQGFLPPQENWFQGSLMTLMFDIVADSTFVERGYWHIPWWHKLIKRFQGGEVHLASSLWKLLIGEMWQVYFIKRLDFESRVSVFR